MAVRRVRLAMSIWVSWAVLVLLLCWAVGAYGRLVRLRAQVLQAFAALDAQLVRQLIWTEGSLPVALREVRPAGLTPQADALQAAWHALRSASEQLADALAAARPLVFDPTALDALTRARCAHNAAWLRIHGLGQQLGDAALAGELQAQHELLLSQTLPLCGRFNQAVHAYNGAIGQFPARLLARLIGLRRTGLLQPMALVA